MFNYEQGCRGAQRDCRCANLGRRRPTPPYLFPLLLDAVCESLCNRSARYPVSTAVFLSTGLERCGLLSVPSTNESTCQGTWKSRTIRVENIQDTSIVSHIQVSFMHNNTSSVILSQRRHLCFSVESEIYRKAPVELDLDCTKAR
jgi:hypothetical protein